MQSFKVLIPRGFSVLRTSPSILKETTVQKVRNSGELVEGSSALVQTIGPETIIRDHDAIT